MDEGPDFSARGGTGSLLDAVLLISSGLDLRASLDRLVRASCSLTGARYGVLGILDADGVVADFVIHGVDDETRSRIASLPTCQGILGVLIEDPKPLRLHDVADHARSIGFPPNHPPMSSFLGVPVRVDGKVYGNLYLTEKAGGDQFTEQDESLLEVLAQVAGSVIANARTHAITERRHRWLEASIAMSDGLQGATDITAALGQVAGHLRKVADAALVAVIADPGGGPVVVAVDDRDGGTSEIAMTALLAGAEATIARAGASGQVEAVPRLEASAVLVVPLRSQLAPGHSLLVAIDDPALGVEEPDAHLLAAFADQAALALDRTQALAERQEHVLVADRDRIARDLHDTVIQRLFATALQLQGLRRAVSSDAVKLRLDETVGELNTTIRDIRSTIFELRHDDGASLKTEIRRLAREYVPVLGFTPLVRIRGPVDVAVPVQLGEHLIASLREALSNVARHSGAEACAVEVGIVENRLVLRVSDNGRGIGDEVCESGLSNVRRRATDHGGRFRILPEDPHGTVLTWEVPLPTG